MRDSPQPQGRAKGDVFDTLVDDILSRRLLPGAPLAERALADRFGLSRTPIREVLLRLQSEYLVDFYPNQGAFVRRLTPNDVRDLFQLREALEPLAAGLAATRRPDDELAALRQAFATIGDPNETTPDAMTELGERLHDANASWSGNALLLDIYATLRKQTRLVRSMTSSHHDVEAVSFGEHVAVLEALERRDATAARERMMRHLKRSHAVVIDLMIRS